MSFINRHSKEIFCKIIYTGPPQSGKTTNLQWIYKSTAINQQDSKIMTLPIKASSTDFFDFLPLGVGKFRDFSTRLHLYTIPGEQLFNSTSKIIFKGVDGIVFIADSNPVQLDRNVEYMNHLKMQLAEENYELKKIPLVIQYNKRDITNALPIFSLRSSLNFYNSPDVEAIARVNQGVLETLKLISKTVIAILKGGNLH